MLRQTTDIQYRNTALVAVQFPMPAGDLRPAASDATRIRLAAELAVDETLDESFPASDPPSWNPGIARPVPAVRQITHGLRYDTGADVPNAGVVRDGGGVDRSMSRTRALMHTLVSLGGGASIALLVPFVILLIGLPVVLSVRGVIEVMGWLLGLFS